MPLDASIPLRASQAPDPLDAATKIYTLKAAKQQADMGDLQLQDSMALRQAIQDPDVQGPNGQINFSALMMSAVKKGVSPNALMTLSKAADEQKARQLQKAQAEQAIGGKIQDYLSKSSAALLPQIEADAKLVGIDAAVKKYEPQLKQIYDEVDPMMKQLGKPHPPLDMSKTEQIYQGMKASAAQYKPMSQAEQAKLNQPQSQVGKITADIKSGVIDPATGKKAIEKSVTPASMYGAAAMSDESIRFTAQQYLTGDTTAAQGYARNPTIRAKLQEAIVQEAKAQGMSAKDVSAKVAEFKGILSGERSLGTRTAQVGMAVNEATKMAPLALDASEQLSRTGIRTFNDIQNAIRNKTESPELRRFVAANNSLVNIYARAINPTGVPTVSDKEHARDVLSVGFSKGDYKAAVDQLMKEMEAAQASPEMTRQEFRTAVTGEGPKPQKERKPLSAFGGG